MKTVINYNLILLVIVFSLTTTCAYSYPPDNAAVLYYKAAVRYEVDNDMAKMLTDLQKGKIEVNDKIREFVKKNRLIIKTVLDATEVKNCDWGMDFSDGMAMDMPPLGSFRKLARLVIADAKILADDGNYEDAIGRCMSLYRMARHINDRVFISYMVAIAINAITNECLIQIISDMPQSLQNLTELKNQLIEIDSIPFSVKPAILGEREAVLIFMTPEQLPNIVKLCEFEKSVKEKILSISIDEVFLERNRTYFENYYTEIIAGFDMPYTEGYATLENLVEKVEKETKNNPDAILTGILAPATHKIFSLKTRLETHNNAIKAAVELYIIRAKTGKLPEELPADLPKDLFSNKPFLYEKTADGFILRCQGKDLSKDKTYEYEFKTKN